MQALRLALHLVPRILYQSKRAPAISSFFLEKGVVLGLQHVGQVAGHSWS
jgi:hypothetical protein